MTQTTPKTPEPSTSPTGAAAPKERQPTAMELAMQAAKQKKARK